jgi:transposase
VIPPKANRKFPQDCDFALYCERDLVERFFNKLKHFRAIATRYDKLARNFLSGIHLTSARCPSQLKAGPSWRLFVSRAGGVAAFEGITGPC